MCCVETLDKSKSPGAAYKRLRKSLQFIIGERQVPHEKAILIGVHLAGIRQPGPGGWEALRRRPGLA
jgi:hypothetical protein